MSEQELPEYFDPEFREQLKNFIENHRTLWQLVEEQWGVFQSQRKVELEKTPEIITTENADENKDNNDMGIFKPATQPTEIQPIFTLPSLSNGKQGDVYEVSLSTFQGGEIQGVQFEPEIGLMWDKEKNAITGTPVKEGSVKVTLTIKHNLGKIFTLGTEIYINGDPKAMWKSLSSEGQSFCKPDQAHQQIYTPNGLLLAGRMRGRTHAQNGTCCDDDFAIGYHEKSAVHLAVVSDGAGSAKFSRYGSKLAVNVVKDKLFQFLDATPNLITLLKIADRNQIEKREGAIRNVFGHLVHNVMQKHINAEKQYKTEHGMDLKSLSCTLLFAFVVQLDDGQWLTANYWIGDGAAAIYQPEIDKATLLGTVDSGAYSGETQFLTDADLTMEEVSVRTKIRIDNQPPILMLMTDGVSDPKFHTEANLAKTDSWKELWQQDLQPLLTAENPAESLEKWLDFWSIGEHDDRTLAMFVPTQYLPTHSAQPAENISVNQTENTLETTQSAVNTEQVFLTKNLNENHRTSELETLKSGDESVEQSPILITISTEEISHQMETVAENSSQSEISPQSPIVVAMPMEINLTAENLDENFRTLSEQQPVTLQKQENGNG